MTRTHKRTAVLALTAIFTAINTPWRIGRNGAPKPQWHFEEKDCSGMRGRTEAALKSPTRFRLLGSRSGGDRLYCSPMRLENEFVRLFPAATAKNLDYPSGQSRRAQPET